AQSGGTMNAVSVLAHAASAKPSTTASAALPGFFISTSLNGADVSHTVGRTGDRVIGWQVATGGRLANAFHVPSPFGRPMVHRQSANGEPRCSSSSARRRHHFPDRPDDRPADADLLIGHAVPVARPVTSPESRATS